MYDVNGAGFNLVATSDVKRGQNLKAEAKASRPRPKFWGLNITGSNSSSDCNVVAEGEKEQETVSYMDLI